MPVRLLLGGAMLALTLLAVRHTAATLDRGATNDAKVVAAFAAMRSAVVPRTAGWFPRNMSDFDLGMNLNLSLALVTVVALLGLFAQAADSNPLLVGRLLIPLSLFLAAVGVTSFVFFAALPAVGL